MSHRSALIAVVVIGVSACGSGSKGPARAVAGGASGTPARYLQIASAANTSVDAARSRLRGGGADLASTEADLRAIAAAKRTFDAALRALVVPTAAQPAVNDLLAADAVLDAQLDAGSSAPTPAELDADWRGSVKLVIGSTSVPVGVGAIHPGGTRSANVDVRVDAGVHPVGGSLLIGP